MEEKEVEKLLYEALGVEAPPKSVLDKARVVMQNSPRKNTRPKKRGFWYGIAACAAAVVMAVSIPLNIYFNDNFNGFPSGAAPDSANAGDNADRESPPDITYPEDDIMNDE